MKYLAASLVCTIGIAGCGGSGGGLGEGVEVVVNDDGSIELVVDGRGLFAISGQVSPMVRNFTEQPAGNLGITRFVREDEVSADLALVSTGGSASAIATYDDGAGRTGTLSAQSAGDGATRFILTLDGDAYDSLALPIRCDEQGTFHGFGEQYNATNQRGEAFPLFVNEQGNGRDGSDFPFTGDAHTTYFPMPYYLDARGFGVLFETSRRVDVDLCATDGNVAWIEVVSGKPLQWLVFHGPTALDVIDQLGAQVGRPAQPPEWAHYLWLAEQGGREALENEVAAVEAAGVPVSAFWVQDWTGIRINFDGGFGVQYRWNVDESLYPNFGQMVTMLHDSGYKFLGYVNPFVDSNLDDDLSPDHFAEMDAQNLLVLGGRGSLVTTAPNWLSAHPDFTNPAARAFVHDALARIVTEYGVDGWMADFAEWLPLSGRLFDGSDIIEAHNTYPIEWQRATREVMDELRPDGDWAMIARSGWTGVQAVAQIHWVGDQETTWSELDGLPTVVPAMLNLGLGGQPYVTHDIAGFAKVTPEMPSTKELFMRWTELGAFTPIMRTHEGADKVNNWTWNADEETTDHFRKFTFVHCALKDEFMALATEAQSTSAPLVRHMMLNFPEDTETWDLSDQFMIGDTLLVAPVVAEGATDRSVYFPTGTWFDVWTGESVEGGQRLTVDGPLGSPPVFSLGADRADLRSAQEQLSYEDCRLPVPG